MQIKHLFLEAFDSKRRLQSSVSILENSLDVRCVKFLSQRWLYGDRTGVFLLSDTQRRSRFNVSIASEVFMDLSIIILENRFQEAFFSYTNLVPATSSPNHVEEGRGFKQQRRCWMPGLAGCVFWLLLHIDLLVVLVLLMRPSNCPPLLLVLYL